MRTALAIAAPVLLAVAGCGQPAPSFDQDEVRRLLGDAGHVEPATPLDCSAMIEVARKALHYGPGVVAPRLRSDYFYQNCAWAESGITFKPRTPDNRFIWISFDAVHTDERESYVDTYRANDGDGLQHTRCHLNRSGDGWRLLECADMGVIMQQGQE